MMFALPEAPAPPETIPIIVPFPGLSPQFVATFAAIGEPDPQHASWFTTVPLDKLLATWVESVKFGACPLRAATQNNHGIAESETIILKILYITVALWHK